MPHALAARIVDDLAEMLPSHATMWGIRGHDHRWEDLSPAGEAARLDRYRALLAEVRALPRPDDRAGRLAIDVAIDHLETEIGGIEAGELGQTLRHVASPVANIPHTLLAMPDDVPALAARLEGIAALLDGWLETLFAAPPVAARQLRSAIGQARAAAEDDGVFARLAVRHPGLAGPSARARAAYAAFADRLAADYRPTERDGVGAEAYTWALRRHLGAAIDPDEAEAWGWDEIRRIQARIDALVDEPVHEVFARLQREDGGDFLAFAKERQERALALVAPHFAIAPGLERLDVRRMPPGSPPGAWYTAPSEDLSRPGTVWYAFDTPPARWDQVSTAYHEGFPGHHLQVGTQVTLTGLSRLHRVVYGYAAFAEGWALYAEELMGELGGYELPAYELGMLSNQMVRACRVVFDIGAHRHGTIPADAPFHPGERWSFALGVELMHRVAGMTRERAESDVTRYYGWPGQAPSYKLGQRAILALRREFLASGGTLRAFHARVLGCGNVGLDRLRAEVLG